MKRIEKLQSLYLSLTNEEQEEFKKKLNSSSTENSELSKLLSIKEKSELTSCPYCNSREVISRGMRKSVRKMSCKSCLKYFSSTTNTSIYRIHKKDKWEAYLRCMEDGLTIRKSAKRVGISIQTAFDWRHKILSSLSHLHANSFESIVEIDEMSVINSQKGERNLDRPSRKRGGKRIGPTITTVLVSVDRKGNILAKNTGQGSLKRPEMDEQLVGKFSKENILCTDGYSGYKGLAKRENLEHKKIDPSKSMTLKDKTYHIQTVNAMHHQIRDLIRRHKGVSTKYLQNYLNWFVAEKKLRSKTNQMMLWICWSIAFSNSIT